MATAETARLIAELLLNDKQFLAELRKAEKGISKIEKRTGAFSGFVNRNMGRALDSLALKVVNFATTGLEELATLEDATSSVTGAIQQVGKGWTITADDIAVAANRIESETDAAFDDKAIVAASETLIRYGKVSEKNLVPAMEVMTDLAARTGDVDSAATLLAKALADPAKAAGKLARAGVVLTKEQQKQIKAMVEAGDTAGAQTFLLEQLEKTTKGAAAASAGPYRDALNKLGDAGEDLRRGFVTGLAPAILEVSDLLTDELAKPSTMQTLKNVGKELGSALKGIIGIAKSLPWGTIGNSLKIAGAGAKAVLDAFLGLPPWIQTAVLTGWGLNKLTGGALSGIVGSLASGLIKGVLGITAGTVIVNGPVGGVPGAGGGGGLLGTAAKLLIPVTIAAVTVGAAQALTDAINPSFGRRLHEGDTPLSPRDPRRFNRNGQVVAEFEEDLDNAGKKVDALGVKFGRMAPKVEALGVRFGRITPKTTPNQRRENMRERAQPQIERATQAAANAIKNAQSIQSRENSAQKAELGNIKNAMSTVGTKVDVVAGAVKALPPLFNPGVRLDPTQVISIRESADQKAEINNLRNATATLDATVRTQAVAQIATDVLQGSLQAGRDAVQAAATRTGAAQTTAATRGVAPPIVGTLAAGFASLAATIWAARPPAPVIQSTTIIQKYAQSERGGATSDSRTRRD